MRISIIDDPGEFNFLELAARIGEANRICVFVDGVEIDDVQTADEEAGFVLKEKRDANGELMIIDDEWATEELRGKVEIKIVPRDKVVIRDREAND